MEPLDDLKQRLREFARERDWEQFPSPKNLSMALIVEAAELVEHFQWLTEAQSKHLPEKTLREVEQEMADVFIYLNRMADLLGGDLMDAGRRNTEPYGRRYPAAA